MKLESDAVSLLVPFPSFRSLVSGSGHEGEVLGVEDPALVPSLTEPEGEVLAHDCDDDAGLGLLLRRYW